MLLRAQRLFVGFLFALGAAHWARAHDPGLSTSRIECSADAIRVIASFSPVDASQLLAETDRVGGFSTLKPKYESAGKGLYTIRLDNAVLVPTNVKVSLLEGDNVEFTIEVPRGTGRSLFIQANFLERLPPGHREYTIVNGAEGVTLLEKLLHRNESGFTLDLPVVTQTEISVLPASVVAEPHTEHVKGTFRSFLKLGVEHILTGYDHLLFLFGLLVVCSRWRPTLAIITSFTLGHSLTLILATLNVVTLPGRIVEPLIAASIVLVAVENLVRRGKEPKGRWALTFSFGLIHGFGFASVLRELGVGDTPGGLLVPLFSFNLGVEMGQLAIAALVLPAIWWFRSKPTYLRFGVPALSALVGAAGLYWLIERTVLA